MTISTHELSEILKKLAAALKRGPDVDAREAVDMLNFQGGLGFPVRSPRKKSRSEDLPIALSALLSLSTVDKRDWIALISDLGLNIEVRPRDASRDILGKVLRVLEVEPKARERLQQKVRSKDAQASPELAQALSSLLGN